MKKTSGLAVLIPALFFAGMLALLLAKPSFQFDYDEGVEVMKASLYLQGFRLYQPLWNDQPPLLTGVVAAAFGLFGRSVLVARLVVLGFAAGMLWSFGQVVRLSLEIQQRDRPSASAATVALVAMGLLAIAPDFAFLSISVMFGLPAIALTIFSLQALLFYQKSGSYRFLILSGILFALSLQTKLFTAPLILLFLSEILFSPVLSRASSLLPSAITGKRRQIFNAGGDSARRATVLWLMTVLAVFLGIGLLFQSLRPDLLLSVNLGGQVRQAFRDRPSFWVVVEMLQSMTVFLVLGAIATWTRRTEYRIPLLWLVIMLPVLLIHQPLWYHYSLLLAVPLCWMAAGGLVQLWQGLNPWRWGRPIAPAPVWGQGILVVVGVAIALQVFQSHRTGYEGSQHFQQQMALVAQLAAHRETQWIFTDVPMYAFRAGLNVPPEIAVFSRKRLRSGNLPPAQLCEVLQKYQPQQLLWGRFLELDATLQDCILPGPGLPKNGRYFDRAQFRIGDSELIYYSDRRKP